MWLIYVILYNILYEIRRYIVWQFKLLACVLPVWWEPVIEFLTGFWVWMIIKKLKNNNNETFEITTTTVTTGASTNITTTNVQLLYNYCILWTLYSGYPSNHMHAQLMQTLSICQLLPAQSTWKRARNFWVSTYTRM